MKRVVCKNQQGEEIEFRYDGWPLRLAGTDGFSSAEYTISTTQNSGQDGENYNGTTANKRNPIITAEIFADYQAQRDKLYNFFQPRSKGEIYHYEDDDLPGRKAEYYVEKVDVEESGAVRTSTISLICPDPKWYDLEDQLTELASWEGLIEWDLEIIEEPFELTRKVNTLIGNVYNGSNVTQGLTVKFMATGEVINPSLYNIDRQELMKLNLTMHPGDTVIITTEQGNKRVKLTSAGVTTNINNYMVYPPVWLQAYPGDNLYRYDAESGIDNLNVSIIHTQAYWGV